MIRSVPDGSVSDNWGGDASLQLLGCDQLQQRWFASAHSIS